MYTCQPRCERGAVAGLTVPAHTRLFAAVALQYQLVGSMAFGPLAASDSAATVARTEASFNYHTLKLGMRMWRTRNTCTATSVSRILLFVLRRSLLRSDASQTPPRI